MHPFYLVLLDCDTEETETGTQGELETEAELGRKEERGGES